MKKHIILDIVFMWSFSVFSTILGLRLNSFDILLFNTLLSIWYFVRTLRWIAFLYDKVFKKTITVKSNGYRFLTRERIYAYDLSKKYNYSVLEFDDAALKGKYVLLDDNRIFKSGEFLEITYYKNSKVIESISKV